MTILAVPDQTKLCPGSPAPETRILIWCTWCILIHNTVVGSLVTLCRDLEENGFGHARKVGPVSLPADVWGIRGE